MTLLVQILTLIFSAENPIVGGLGYGGPMVISFEPIVSGVFVAYQLHCKLLHIFYTAIINTEGTFT